VSQIKPPVALKTFGPPFEEPFGGRPPTPPPTMSVPVKFCDYVRDDNSNNINNQKQNNDDKLKVA